MVRLSFVKKVCDGALIAGAMMFVVCFYHWTIKSSGGFNPPGEEDYYNFLVRGWRHGHLYMAKEPRAEMLTLSDPYDPAQNSTVRLPDASYFKGHNYLYFGPAPAVVLMLPYGIITGKEMGTTPALFIYCTSGFLLLSGVWLGIRYRYFPDSRMWIGPLGVLVLGFGTHVLALARRPLVWELPISAGFAFATLSLAAIYAALHGRRPVWMMGLAGISLGLAVASRPTWILASLAFVPALWSLWKVTLDVKVRIRCALAVTLGLSVCVACVLIHNYARFGDFFEFGQNYQLTGIYESKAEHFSVGYIAHNVYIYYLHGALWTSEFPFVSATAVRGGPVGYLGGWNEAICGLAVTFPFVLLGIAAPLACQQRSPNDNVRLKGILGAIIAVYIVMSAAILTYFLATPRYMADFAPSLALLSAIGLLGIERYLNTAVTRHAVLALCAAAGVITVVTGILVSFDYHGRMLRTLSPQSWVALERLFRIDW